MAVVHTPDWDPDNFIVYDANKENTGDTRPHFVKMDPRIATLLKPHQVIGVKFLVKHILEGSGCVLADFMGLGKTMQVICSIQVLYQVATPDAEGLMSPLLADWPRGTKAPKVLILSPAIVVRNWEAEFKKFLPKDCLNPLAVSILDAGTCKTLDLRRALLLKWHRRGGVLIMGYEMFRGLVSGAKTALDSAYQMALGDPGPDLIVLDEGHRIKDNSSQLSRALATVRTQRRVVLTGYPLQNRLKEYWCMCDFVKPNILGTMKDFQKHFESKIKAARARDASPHVLELARRRAHVVTKLLKPIVLRRDSSYLRRALPPKHEWVIMCHLTPLQASLYKAFLRDKRRAAGLHIGNTSHSTEEGVVFADDGMQEVAKTSNRDILAMSQVSMMIVNHPDVVYLNMKDLDAKEDREAPAPRQLRRQAPPAAAAPPPPPPPTAPASAGAGLPPPHIIELVDSDEDDLDLSLPPALPGNLPSSWPPALPGMPSPLAHPSPVPSLPGMPSPVESAAVPTSGIGVAPGAAPPSSLAPPTAAAAPPMSLAPPAATLPSTTQFVPPPMTTVSAPAAPQDDGDSDVEGMAGAGERHTHMLAWAAPFLTDHKLGNAEHSAKFCLAMGLLSGAAARNEKCTLFSQNLRTLSCFEAALKAFNAHHPDSVPLKSLRIDGSTPLNHRFKLIQQFNSPTSGANVMLVSTRAGGEGINLVGGNRIIIFDVCWNPSHDHQAMCRSYRFGQTRPTFVYRLVGRKTIEERIYNTQVAKEKLARRIVDDRGTIVLPEDESVYNIEEFKESQKEAKQAAKVEAARRRRQRKKRAAKRMRTEGGDAEGEDGEGEEEEEVSVPKAGGKGKRKRKPKQKKPAEEQDVTGLYLDSDDGAEVVAAGDDDGDELPAGCDPRGDVLLREVLMRYRHTVAQLVAQDTLGDEDDPELAATDGEAAMREYEQALKGGYVPPPSGLPTYGGAGGYAQQAYAGYAAPAYAAAAYMPAQAHAGYAQPVSYQPIAVGPAAAKPTAPKIGASVGPSSFSTPAQAAQPRGVGRVVARARAPPAPVPSGGAPTAAAPAPAAVVVDLVEPAEPLPQQASFRAAARQEEAPAAPAAKPIDLTVDDEEVDDWE